MHRINLHDRVLKAFLAAPYERLGTCASTADGILSGVFDDILPSKNACATTRRSDCSDSFLARLHAVMLSECFDSTGPPV